MILIRVTAAISAIHYVMRNFISLVLFICFFVLSCLFLLLLLFLPFVHGAIVVLLVLSLYCVFRFVSVFFPLHVSMSMSFLCRSSKRLQFGNI